MGFAYLSFKDYLISQIIFVNNLSADPRGSMLIPVL
jgi:hypothetical protein